MPRVKLVRCMLMTTDGYAYIVVVNPIRVDHARLTRYDEPLFVSFYV